MMVLWLTPLLEFDIDGEVLASSDGKVSLLEVDLLASNSIESVVQQVGTDAQVIGEAGDLLRGNLVLLDQETDWWANLRSGRWAFSEALNRPLRSSHSNERAG